MLDTLKKAWRIPDLRSKILFTLAMLFIFRLGANIPAPGIDRARVLAGTTAQEGLLGFFNLMSGGAFGNLSLFALGISPYITSSIVMNLLQIAVPYFENLAKEGESGRKKMAQYTRYLAVVLALFQGLAMASTIFRPYFKDYNTFSLFIVVLSLTAGTAFLMYLGEKINENGIGNGISLFIYAGIISRLPVSLYATWFRLMAGDINVLNILLFAVVAIAIVAGVIFITEGQRRIPVQYSKRVVGRKMYGGHTSHIPLKVNQTGVIPIIFAISILMFPATITGLIWPGSAAANFFTNSFTSRNVWYNLFYALLIIFFTYFYTSVTFNPIEIAENMKKNGGFIPGIRPGTPTTNFIARSLNRLTIVGAIFLAIIAILPTIILVLGKMPMGFGGTSLLIVVGVALETVKQIEAQMVMRHYKGFLK